LPAERILFLSDIAQELAAAQEAGMAVTQLLRDGAAPDHAAWPVATSFREILIEAAT
jgi:methionine salvage enolase-phosphatase E1